MTPMYTATATARGGRSGHVESDDGRLKLNLAPPSAMGGNGQGANPEQLFAAGYAACFQSAMEFVAKQQGIDASGSTVEGHVALGKNDRGKGFMLGVRHVVTLPNLDRDAAEKLVQEAHEVCPYSNATRGNVAVEFDVRAGR